MTIKKLWEVGLFCVVFGLAIILIENQGETWLIEAAGDIFGAIALMALATFMVVKDLPDNN